MASSPKRPPPPPNPKQAAVRSASAGLSEGQSSAFSRFQMAPALIGFNAKRAGRRSLIGGV